MAVPKRGGRSPQAVVTPDYLDDGVVLLCWLRKQGLAVRSSRAMSSGASRFGQSIRLVAPDGVIASVIARPPRSRSRNKCG